jgi:hypothetical protein
VARVAQVRFGSVISQQRLQLASDLRKPDKYLAIRFFSPVVVEAQQHRRQPAQVDLAVAVQQF